MDTNTVEFLQLTNKIGYVYAIIGVNSNIFFPDHHFAMKGKNSCNERQQQKQL